MAGVGAGLFFVTLLVWAPAAWLYFDAADRGHSSYLWGGLALIPFWNVVVIVAYFIVRSRADKQPGLEYSRVRIYQHVAVFTFWSLVAVGVASVLFGLIGYARADDPPPFFQEPRGTVLRETLAFASALLVISIPALGVHYAFIERQLRRTTLPSADRQSLARLQSGQFSVLMVLGSIVAALTTVMLVFSVSGRLFDVGELDRGATTFAMSALPVALLSLALTFGAFWFNERFQAGRTLVRGAEASVITEPSSTAAVDALPSETPAEAVVRFCSQCGVALVQGAKFCPSCGAAVESA